MTIRQKIGAVCIFFVAMVVVLKVYKKYNVAPKVKFKTLELTNLNDQIVTWDQIRKPVFISFFGTWCGSCRKEIPDLIALQKILDADTVSIILISDEPTETLQNYVTTNKIPFQVYHATDNFKDMGIVKFPTSYLVDKNGHIIYSATDAQDWTNHKIVEELKEGIRLFK